MLRIGVQGNSEPTEELVDLKLTKKQSQSVTQRKMEKYYYNECIAQTLGHCKKEMECNYKKGSLIILLDTVHTGGESLQNWLRDANFVE